MSSPPGALALSPARFAWNAIVTQGLREANGIASGPEAGVRQAIMTSGLVHDSASAEGIVPVVGVGEPREVAAADDNSDDNSRPANQEAAEQASTAGPSEREPSVSVAGQSGMEQPASVAEQPGPEPAGLGFDQRPITSLTVNIAAKAGELPDNLGRDSLARIEAKRPEAVLLRHWPLLSCQWEAPALAYRPLYFEEANLERHGYGLKYLRAAQPIVSAGQFFTTVPILPYKMLAEPARTPVYTLGQYRPGSDVPYRPVFPPLSISGSAAEAGLAAGLIFAIP